MRIHGNASLQDKLLHWCQTDDWLTAQQLAELAYEFPPGRHQMVATRRALRRLEVLGLVEAVAVKPRHFNGSRAVFRKYPLDGVDDPIRDPIAPPQAPSMASSSN